MDYKEKVIALLNSQELSKEQKEKLESIFPELAKSDDKRIRKVLTKYFRGSVGLGVTIDGVKVKDIVTWLEKQGDKVNAIEGFETEFERQVSGLIASAINKEHEYNQGYVKWTANALLNYAKHELEKQGEQKPNPCDGCVNRKGCINCENGELRETAQKPADEVDLPEFESHLCLMFQKFRTKGICTNGEIIDYVKEHSQKLKDILVKPAWSEEDEYNLQCMIAKVTSDIQKGNVGRNNELINWLKSLKDKYTWKPSDEQIEALLKLEEMHVLEHEKNQENAHLYMVVKSIREQLLKLREE